ncbi:hypothetical protein GCM10020000_45160 [Streptomyces olivoverticillatus]
MIWTPGNHELWTPNTDPVQLRGVARYERLVELCRGLGVATPEDPWAVWEGEGGPVAVAPLFTLYDYSFRTPPPRPPRPSRWLRPARRGSSAPTSTCWTRSRTRRSTTGAAPG